MRELWGLLSLLDRKKWGSETEYYERFGGAPGTTSTPEQIHRLRVRDG